MTIGPAQRRAARHAQSGAPATRAHRRTPITVERITDAALQVVADEGYDALTIRSVAKVLDTGPSSLYTHIVNKTDLDDLIIGRLCSEIVTPDPEPRRWREQIRQVYTQLRDEYLRYPGISRAALAIVPTNLETLRVNEGIFAILLAGGLPAQKAAWAMDLLSLYVAAYTLEISMVRQRRTDPEASWLLSQEELVRRFTALPDETFPNTRRYATEMTSGTGHERFDFALDLLITSIAA